MNSIRKSKKLFIFLCLAGILTAGFLVYHSFFKDDGAEQLKYSGKGSFLEKAEQGQLREIYTSGQQIWGLHEESGRLVKFKTSAPLNPVFYIGNNYYSLEDFLRITYRYNYPDVNLQISPTEMRSKLSLETYLFYGAGYLFMGAMLFGIFYIFVGKQWLDQKKFLETAARMFTGQKVSFDDVAGIDEVKEELEEVVYFVKEPEEYKEARARVPKGIILNGPPGCGKTLIAKAVACKANVPVLGISGSEFVEMYVGVGAARVRALFKQAKKIGRCIIVLDEADSLLRHRGGSDQSGGKGEQDQAVNQFMVEMDGFESGQGIVVLALTNRLDMLDPAAIRPGRFDKKIYVPLPDAKGREEILKIHTKEKPLSEDVNLTAIARSLKLGTSGADIGNICNEAAILAVRERRKEGKK